MKLYVLIALSLLVSGLSWASPVTTDTNVENPLFGYTHLLPSPLTLPAGRLALGTTFSYGIFDFLEISTNVLSDIYQVYNISAKVMLVDAEEFSLALTFTAESFNYDNISGSNPNIQVTSYLPGFVTGFEIIPDVALFIGGNLNYTQANLTTDGVSTSGYVQGARAESDLSWAYNHTKKHLGNVLSGGVSYDFSYKIAGFGVSHHWKGFQLGVHYYPNATDYKVQPILVGGATFDI